MILSTKLWKYLYLFNWENCSCQRHEPECRRREGGESTRGGIAPLLVGGGVRGTSPGKFLKCRMLESASETIFQLKNRADFAVKWSFLSDFLSFFKKCIQPLSVHWLNINIKDIITVGLIVICVVFQNQWEISKLMRLFLSHLISNNHSVNKKKLWFWIFFLVFQYRKRNK